MTMHMRRKTAIAAALAALTLGAAAPAVAQDDMTANEAIQHRQDTLAVAGAATKSLACSIKGEGCPRAFDYMGLQARAIAYAAKMAPEAFRGGPYENATVDTTALPKIWDDYGKFTQGFEKMEQGAQQMVQAAADKDMDGFVQAFKDTTKACENCHDTFREE